MKKQKNLPIYDIVIDENEMSDQGVRFISIVDKPAIEIKGMAFNEIEETCNCGCHDKDHNFANYSEGKLPHPIFMVDNLIGGVFKLWDKNESYDAYSHPNCNCFIDNKGDWNVVDEVDLNGNVYPCDICLAKQALWDSSGRKQQFVNLLGRSKIKKAVKKFSMDNFEFEFSAIEDKQIIAGPALIPDINIYRKDDDGEYYVKFSKATIQSMVNKFNKGNNSKSINFQHSEQMVNAFIQQNWIVEDKLYDKSKMYGFDLPIGTWFVEVKIEDKQFWNDIVKGMDIKSFSVEGLMGQRLIKRASLEQIIDDLDENEVNEILEMFKDIVGSGTQGILFN
jgi:hypothetical protein